MSQRAPPDQDRTVDDFGREFIAHRHRFPASGVGFLVAPVLWFVYFVAIYGLQGAGCAAGLHARGTSGISTLDVLLALLTVLVAGIIALLGLWSYRAWKRLLREIENEERQVPGQSTFLAYGALLHAGLFLVATLWIGLPALFLEPCGTP